MKIEREVAAAIFQLDLINAIRILSNLDTMNNSELSLEKRNNYKFLAFALGGYSEERREMWRGIYRELHPKLDDPYLRAALAFLSWLVFLNNLIFFNLKIKIFN